MVDEPLDDQYLSWLYARIGSVRQRDESKTYWRLFRQLYSKEFTWFIANDDNRVEDGRDLRHEFLRETGAFRKIDSDWMNMGCSCLELLMGLAVRLAFDADRTPRYWFLHLLHNLELDGVTDREYRFHPTQSEDYVNDKLEQLIWRTYSPDGSGGLFPLRYPAEDQREVELYYQLSAYILERV